MVDHNYKCYFFKMLSIAFKSSTIINRRIFIKQFIVLTKLLLIFIELLHVNFVVLYVLTLLLLCTE